VSKPKYRIKKVTDETTFVLGTTEEGLVFGFDFRGPAAQKKGHVFECWELEEEFAEQMIAKLAEGLEIFEQQRSGHSASRKKRPH
jgi:hypothetical protein